MVLGEGEVVDEEVVVVEDLVEEGDSDLNLEEEEAAAAAAAVARKALVKHGMMAMTSASPGNQRDQLVSVFVTDRASGPVVAVPTALLFRLCI